jgi:threonine/homoserine/homoserine lactone efflux protein
VLAQLPAFLGVAAVVIVVPGPDTALTVRNALAGGRRCGVATAAGVATGQAVWTLATGVGVAELVQASEPAFLVMKIAGAAYLVFLGLQSLLAAAGARFPGRLRSPTGGPGDGGRGSSALGEPGQRKGGRASGPGGAGGGAPAAGSPAPGGGGVGRGFRQGVVSNLANPKMAAFFLSLLPQFVGPGAGVAGLLGLGLVFCLMTFAWLALYSVAVDRAQVVLGRSWVRRVLDGVSGVVLVGFGARLALQQR